MSRHGSKGVVSAALIASVVPYMLQTSDNPDGTPQKVFDGIADGIKEDRARFFHHTFFPQFFGQGLLTQSVSDEVITAATATALQAGLKPTLACAEAFATTDFRPDLPHFKVPTLIIHGTSDKTVPIDASARAASKAIPGSTLLEYDGSPHGLTETDGERLTSDLLSFLSTTSAKAASWA